MKTLKENAIVYKCENDCTRKNSYIFLVSFGKKTTVLNYAENIFII